MIDSTNAGGPLMDKIVAGLLKDFAKAHSLESLGESEVFEHFVNYCVVSREHPENVDFEAMRVAGPNDSGLDGVAVLVNEHIVSSKEDIDHFKTHLRRLDVRFIFTQSTISESFDSGHLGTFLFGVSNFFETTSLPVNESIQALRHLKDHIYESSMDMERRPNCDIYYATTGRWRPDAVLTARINHTVDNLKPTDLFSDVSFTILDSEVLRTIYRELKHKVETEIAFEKHTILPKIDHVQEAYVGILPSNEYLKLICDADGKLRRSLFYDNVRDFQGNNPVNQEIASTLKDKGQNDTFVLLNNGITIVARSIFKVGSMFRLRDYQIVNGCQTSHILFLNGPADGNVFVPVKLIVTDNSDVTNLIIKGTKRQTEVKLEALESLTPFQKELEEFFATFGKTKEPSSLW
jgi:hypothetical protein